MKSQNITVTIEIQKPVEKVWEVWNSPPDIQKWNIPFDNWHCPFAENDLREGMKFHYRMESLDGKEGFDHKGIYRKVIPMGRIETIQDDGRESTIEFFSSKENSVIRETFEPEDKEPLDLQRDFCRAVLNRFKKYVELK
jgi:uncharacterized protein YndB with AHSA1/START domain